MELSVALLIPRVVVPCTPPKVAVRLTVPREMAVARPMEPAALEMVASALLEELQATWGVRSAVVPSE